MIIKEKYSFLSNSLTIELDGLNSASKKKLYIINYTKIKKQFFQEIKNYHKYPELVSIEEFAMNYSLGYHICHNIEDFFSKEAMYIEVKKFLESINFVA